jgi:hypothetical protein
VFDELELVCTLGIAADHVGEAVEHLSVQLLAPFPAHLAYSAEPVFVNVYGAQESILRNQFSQPM